MAHEVVASPLLRRETETSIVIVGQQIVASETLKHYEISLMATRSLRIKGYSTQLRLPLPEETVLQ